MRGGGRNGRNWSIFNNRENDFPSEQADNIRSNQYPKLNPFHQTSLDKSKYLNKDTDIKLLTDKGNMIVVITTSNYKKKMKMSFSRTKHTKKLDKDPTNTIAQNTKILMKKNNIPSKTKSLKSTNPLPSRLYYQKYTNHPSQINCQRHTLSDIQFIPRFLVQTLQPLWKIRITHN